MVIEVLSNKAIRLMREYGDSPIRRIEDLVEQAMASGERPEELVVASENPIWRMTGDVFTEHAYRIAFVWQGRPQYNTILDTEFRRYNMGLEIYLTFAGHE